MDLNDEIIIANKKMEEIGVLLEDVDMEIGGKNDFEIYVNKSAWDREKFAYGNYIYMPGTEYGGQINGIKNSTNGQDVTVHGITWRGLLDKTVILPDRNSEFLIVGGNLNQIIRELNNRSNFRELFNVPEIAADVAVFNWQMKGYSTFLEAVNTLLKAQNQKLHIEFIQGGQKEKPYVSLTARPVNNQSNVIEFSEDSLNINLSVEDNRGGINHLICIGESKDKERIIVDLYVQKDGNIGDTIHYEGIEERTEVYKTSGSDIEKLRESGIKRLRDRQNYKETKVDVLEGDYEIADIVSGYDQLTGITVSKEITRKILKRTAKETKIEYKTEGAN